MLFRLAAKNGHLEIIKFLASLPKVDPYAQNNYAMRYATYYVYTKIINFLISLRVTTNDKIKEKICELIKTMK